MFYNLILGQAPDITNPVNQAINQGNSATFSVSVNSGTTPITFQWQRSVDQNVNNFTNISGATNFSYTIPSVSYSMNNYWYRCVATNDSGQVTSNYAVLTVNLPNERVTDGLQVLYDFKEGSGTTVNDVSGVGDPLNLTINNTGSVYWTPKGLNVINEVRIKSSEAASKIYDACTTTNEITLEAWILPSNLTQRNIYGRILTVSNTDIHERNISLMQYGNSYYTQLRTDSTNLNGNPAILNSGITQTLTHFVYTRASNGAVKVYINGVNVVSDQLNGTLSNWANNYYLYLASEVSNGLYWEGTYYLTAIYSKALSGPEIIQNYNMGADADNFPHIVKQPTNKTPYIGKPVTFSVVAIGNGPLTYQWKENGANISGATNSTLTFDARLKDDGNTYSCVVTGPNGSVESNVVTMTVQIPTQRIITGIVAQYTFQEDGGNKVYDMSGFGTPLNLNINNTNAINWGPSGLEINSPAQIFSENLAEKIYNAVLANGHMTIEAWIKPANTTQTGPARIVTYSANSSSVNFSLAQNAAEYEGKFRTTNTSNSGQAVTTNSNIVANELQHVVFVFRSDAIGILYVNGDEQKRVDLGGDFSNWSNTFQLALGGELDGSASWLGTLNYLAIFERRLYEEEILFNYEFGPYGISDINNPSNLNANAVKFGEINLTWSDNTSKEDTYFIERSTGDQSVWAEIANLSENVVTYIDTNVEEGILYYYRCRAYNSLADVYSDYSNIDTVAALLKSPAALVGQASELGKVTLLWTDSSAVSPSFKIERGIGNPVVYSVIDSVSPNVVSYNDNTVEEGVLYYYRVFAYNAYTYSEPSNVMLIRSKASFITAPTNLTSELDAENIYPVLNWTDNAFNEYGFIIERKYETGGSDFVVIDTVSMDVTTYIDSTVGAIGSYSYRIFAYNDEFTSPYSNESGVDVLVSVNEENEIPTEYALLQNYPNPFNPTTNIQFNLIETSKVKLEIYNLLGQKVSTLIENNYSAGKHAVEFNAKNLTSGIYVYSIVVEGTSGKHFKDSKKLILLK